MGCWLERVPLFVLTDMGCHGYTSDIHQGWLRRLSLLALFVGKNHVTGTRLKCCEFCALYHVFDGYTIDTELPIRAWCVVFTCRSAIL